MIGMVTTLSDVSFGAQVNVAGIAAEKSTPSCAVSLRVDTVTLTGCVASPIRVTVKRTLPSFSRTEAAVSFHPTLAPALVDASSAPRASSNPAPHNAVEQLLPAGKARAPARIASRV